MYSQLLTITLFAICTMGEETSESIIKTTVSDGVNSIGFKVVYGDEDLSVINEVVTDEEKKTSKKINLNEAIAPLPPQDVKCLMSVNKHCTKEMGELKSVLIKAVKEDCENCSVQDKERAGKVIASLMAHDPVAWKLFLTRSALEVKKPEGRRKVKGINLRAIGKGEEVVRSPNNMYIAPGMKVRVKRYAAELMP